MEFISGGQIFQLFMALSFVIALMGGLALLLKKLGIGAVAPSVAKAQKRLRVVESQALDARRRLVLLECDDKQHLVILGANGETVITTNITPPQKDNPNV